VIDALGARANDLDHVHCLMSAAFADALVTSPAFRGSYSFDSTSERLRQTSLYEILPWMNVQWEEYRLGNSGLSGGAFLAADKAILFPVMRGESVLEMHFAPGDFFDAYDEPGRPEYVKTARDPELDRWMKLYVQSNPLAVNAYPEAVVPLDAFT
jgi:hypothetical protein